MKLVGSNSIGLVKMVDGKNRYVHIMYAIDGAGKGMTKEPLVDSKYIGILTSEIPTPSQNPNDYAWAKFTGDDGDPGKDGVPGKDGIGVASTTILYAKSSDGLNPPSIGWTNTIPETLPGDYLWTEITWRYTDSTEENSYSVSKIGLDGNTGSDGAPGKDGVGLKGTKIEYAASLSGTVVPTSGWSLSIPSVSAGQYLWTKTVWTYTDNTTETGHSVSRMGLDGSKGKDGADGVAGKDGVGIKSTDITYTGSTNGTTIPTTGWTETIPTVPSGSYLWTKTVWTYTDSKTETGYTVSRIGKDGNTGKDGIAGKDGVGLENTLVQYSQSTSGTVPPTSGWSSSVPTVPSGNFLWTRTIWTYTDDTDEIGYSVARMGVNGKDGTDGIAGKDGVGLKDTVIEYAQSSSGTVKPTSDWSTNIPSVPSGSYLWTRTTWSYTDNTTETGYTVSRIGKDGNTGKDGIAGKDGVGISSTKVEYVGSTSGTTKPTSGWALTIPSVAAGNYLWTKTTWNYTDNTSETGYSVAKMGETGLDGESSYTWVRYSPNADGSNMTAEPTSTSKYIGVAITSDNNPPTDYKLYSWALIKGADGRGVKSTTISYQASSSGTITPTGSWSTTVPSVPKGQYLWTKILITYTDNTDTTSYSISYQGVDGLANIMGFLTNESITLPANSSGSVLTYGGAEGVFEVYEGTNRKTGTSVAYSILSKTNMEVSISTDGSYEVSSVSTGSSIRNAYATLRASYGGITIDKQLNLSKAFTGAQGSAGKDGVAGKDGLGVLTTVITYAISASGTTPPTTGWSAQVPALVKGQYLWTRTTWTYTDSSTETGYTVSYNAKDGNDGNDGIAGKDGVGISNTIIEYVGAVSGTTKPTSGWSTTIPTVPAGQYLWTRTTWQYTDGTSEQGFTNALMGRTGASGKDGVAGKDGVGIKSTQIMYAQSTSGTTAPSSGWTAEVPTLIKGQYLWTQTTWVYTDNTGEAGYTVSYNAKDGNTGKDGIAGKDGVGIASTLIQYVGSTNGTTKPASGWTTTIPTVAEGNYLWTKTTWTYTDGTKEEGFSVAKMGAKGDTGAKGNDGIAGKDGVGIKSTVVNYSQSTNGTTPPTSGWGAAVPTVPAGNYLWTRTTWTYTDNTTETGYNVSRIGKDGNTGKDGIAGKDGVGIKSTEITYVGSTSGTLTPTSDWTTTIPTVSAGNFLWTRTVWTYDDNTTETGYSVAKMGSTGATGSSATSYWLTTSNNIISKSQTGTLSPTTITFTGYSKTGTANSALYAGRFVIQTSTNGTSYTTRYTSSANQNAYTYTIPADTKFIKALLYQAGGTTVLLDEQTVPVVESAEGIEIGVHNILIGTNTDWVERKFNIGAYNYVIQGLYNLSDYGIGSGDEIVFSVMIKGNSESTPIKARFEVYNSEEDRKTFTGNSVKDGRSFVKVVIPDGYSQFRVMIQPDPAPTLKAFAVDYKHEMLTKGNAVVNWRPALEDARNHKAWANSSDGGEDFTRVYPNQNLALGTSKDLIDGEFKDTWDFFPPIEKIDVLEGEAYTYSLYLTEIGSSSPRARATIRWIGSNGSTMVSEDSGNPIYAGESGYSEVSAIAPAGALYARLNIKNGTATANSFKYSQIKFEVGSEPTIYTTNPQDSLSGSVPKYVGFSPIDSDVSHEYEWIMNPEYAQALADEALAGKVDNDAEYENLKNMAEEVKESYEKFVGEGGEYQTEHNKLLARTTVVETDLGEYKQQINFIDTYMSAGNEGLIMGVKDSEGNPDANAMQMLLSNKSLSFMDGGEVVAYFSGQSFHINRGAIVESLQVGQHKITNLGNGHTVFQYTG